MFFIFKPWTDSLGICAEKIFKSSAQQHPSPTQECNLHPWSGFQDPTEQNPEQPGVKKVGSRTRVLPGLPATQIIHDAMRALLSSRDDSGDHPASGGCRAGWVPWAQGASLCLPICTAAFLSGCLIWRQGQKKKKKEVTAKAYCLMYSWPPVDRHSPGQGNVGWFFSTGLHLPSVPSYWSIKGW